MTFLRFLRHVFGLTWRADRRATSALLILTGVQALVVAATGLSFRWLVDAIARHDGVGVAIAVVAGALAFGLGSLGVRVSFTLRVYIMERVDAALTAEVLAASARTATIEHLEHPEYLDRVEILRKGIWALSTVVWSVAGMISAAVSLGASVVLLGLVHPVVALVAVLAVPPLLTSRRAATLNRAAQDACAEANRREQRLHALCIGPDPAKELHITGSATVLDDRADALWRQVTTREAVGRLRGLAWQVVGWACYAVGLLAGLIVVARLIAQGTATVGEAVLVISLSTQLQGQIRLVVWNAGRVAEAGHGVRHYDWLMRYASDRPPGERVAPARLSEGVVLRSVRFRYPGAQRDALRGIDLRLRPGQIVAVVGANGAGKTTLVKLLTGMYHPSAGEILVDGRPLAELEPGTWRGTLSGVFQDFAKFQFRAWETIGVGDIDRLHDRAAVDRAVARANAGTTVRELPFGLDTQLGRDLDGVEPSVGQWQALALTRGFMRPSPVLVVLDEPTAALDPLAEHNVYTYFAQQANANSAALGTITLLVSHRFSTVRMADLIVVFDDGAIAEAGTHDELMAAGGGYAELYRLQADAYITDAPAR